MKRMVLALAAVVVLVLTVGTVFAAGGTKVCVPVKEGAPIKTPKGGNCAAGYTLTELGAEGKEGPQGPEGKEGPKGESGASDVIGVVAANGSVVNGEGFAVTNPSTGEYVISFTGLPICTTIAHSADTVVTARDEGQAVIADAIPSCQAATRKTVVTIYSTSGVRVENGFTFAGRAAP